MANVNEAKPVRVAIVRPGDRAARDTADAASNRSEGVVRALRAVGIAPIGAVYNDDFADEVLEQLLEVDSALVWVNPIQNGRDRTVLDRVLRSAADNGVFVSAHPDVVLAMGTKEVLYQTREMSWGCDAHLYRTLDDVREELPSRLAEGQPRVLKQYRGNGGNGVWKVSQHPTDSALVRVRHALRGSEEQDLPFEAFVSQCGPYFEGDGRMIDQAFQERLAEGMVRCYLVGDEVAGFGHQDINALHPDTTQPGPRIYHPPTDSRFQPIKARMESEWIGELCRTVGIERWDLPVIWDADLLLGPRDSSGEDTYVLCEINVSSVYPFPDSALEPLASLTLARIAAVRGGNS